MIWNDMIYLLYSTNFFQKSHFGTNFDWTVFLETRTCFGTHTYKWPKNGGENHEKLLIRC